VKLTALLAVLCCSCLQEPGEEPAYPSVLAGSRALQSEPSGNCVFSGDGRYAVVGDGTNLLFMELAHCRVHGSTDLHGQVLHVEAAAGVEGVYAATGDSLFRIIPGSFAVSAARSIPPGVAGCALAGGRVFLGFSDGSVLGFDPEDLEETVRGNLPGVSRLAGVPGVLTAASGTSVISLDPVDLTPLASFQAWGEAVRLVPAGEDRMCASILGGNEVALFGLPGMELQLLYTVPGTPLAAAVEPSGLFALAGTDRGALVAVGAGGGVEWITEEYGPVRDVRISADLWNALVLTDQAVFLLER
jgi:hypothetical protein